MYGVYLRVCIANTWQDIGAAASCVVIIMWLTTKHTARVRGRGGVGVSVRVPPENAGHLRCCTNQQQVRRHQQSRVTTHCSRPLNSRQQLQHVFSQNPFGQREAPPKCHTARLGTEGEDREQEGWLRGRTVPALLFLVRRVGVEHFPGLEGGGRNQVVEEIRRWELAACPEKRR